MATEPTTGAGREQPDIDVARIDALYRFAKPAYTTILVISAITMIVLWGPFTADVLVAWFLSVVGVTLARIALHWRYARTPAAARDPLAWESRFAIGALASGCLWAFPPVVFFPASEPLLQAVLVFVVVGSGLGAVGVYGSSMPAFLAFITLPLSATVLQLAMQPGRSYQLLAMMVLVFIAVALWVYRGIHLNFREMLRNRIRNENLSSQLATSEAQLRDALESFPEGVAVFDAADRLVLCNDEYARTYGRGRGAAELAGTAYREIAGTAYEVEAPPGGGTGDLEQWIGERMRRRQQAGGQARVFQLRDGRWLQGRFERTRAGGRISLFTDISELKTAQDAYLKVRAEVDLVLDMLPIGVAFIESRRIARCNATLERMLGFGPGELADKSMRELYLSDAQWEQADRLYDTLDGARTLEADGPLRRKDGSQLWSHVHLRAADPRSPRQMLIAAFTDITERRESGAALKRSEALYRSIVETSNDLIWTLDTGGHWSYVNATAARRIYGCEPAELLGRPMRERIAGEVLERDSAVFQRVLAGESVYDYETRNLRRDGTPVDLSFNAIPLRNAQGEIVGATGTARDVTERKLAAAELHESVEKLRLAAEAADLYYWEWDIEADAMHWGRDPAGLIGRSYGRAPADAEPATPDLRALVHPDDRERYQAAMQQALATGDRYHCEFRILGLDGDTRWIAAEGKVMRWRNGAASRVFGASRDVTSAKRQEEEVRFLAYHDTLTGLPNRRLLDDRLNQAVYLAQRREARVGVMAVDLDHFKQVNDALGHRAGDAVLREVSMRLAACVRRADTMARQGGDEFVIVMPDLDTEADCQIVAEKLLRALEPEFMADGRAFRIGASIGISVFPADARDGEGLLRNADVAMYRAKQLGRNNYRFYSR